jgi:hypothetical protein
MVFAWADFVKVNCDCIGDATFNHKILLVTSDVGSVRWRCFVVGGRRCVSVNSERINVGIARARNQRHHHYRER